MAFKFSKRKKFSGNFPAGDVVTPQYQSGVAVVNSVVAEDVVAERQYPYGSVFYFNADTSTENELAEFGNAFSSSVLGPQYCRQADGSYVDAGDGVPVDVWDGHSWVRSCGAVENLLTNSKFEGGISGSTAVPASTPTGWSTGSAENYVANYTDGLLSLTATNGKYQIYQFAVLQPYTTYRYSSHLISDGALRIPDYMYRANAPVGLTEIYECDGVPVGVNYVPPSGPHQVAIVFTTAENGGSIILRYGIGSVYTVTGSGALSKPQLTATAYQLPYVPTTPSGPVTQPASTATLTSGSKYAIPPSTDLYKALAGKTDGVELLPENGLRNTDAWTPGTGWALNEGTARFSGATGATLTTALTASLPANTRVRATFELAVTAPTSLSLSVGGSTPKTVTTSGQHIIDFTTAVEGTDLTLTAADGSDLGMYGLTLQKIQPATCTVAAVCNVAAGTGDRAILACNSGEPITGSLLHSSGSNPRQSVMSSDGKTVASFTGTSTTTGDYHLKIVQTSADGSMFRVGNKQLGVEAFIKWSDWTIFDGSFDPGSIFSLGFNAQAPVWFNKIAVWDEPVSDEQIVDALWYTDTKLQQFLDTGIGEATFRFKMRTDRAALPVDEVFRPLNNDMIQFHNTGTTGRFVFGDGEASRSEDIDWAAGDTVVLAVQADGFAFRIYELRVVPEDVKLLWPREYSDTGVQRSLVGPNPEWAYAGVQYAEDGKYIGYNEPVDLNGDGQLWWSGPSYTNLLPSGWPFSNTNIAVSTLDDYVKLEKTNTVGSALVAISNIPAGALYTTTITLRAGSGLTGTKFDFGYYYNGFKQITVSSFSGPGTYVVTADPVVRISDLSPTEDTTVSFTLTSALETAVGALFYPGGTASTEVGASVLIKDVILTATSYPVPYVPPGTTVNQIPNYVPAVHGDKGVWCGPSYANLLPVGYNDMTSSSWTKRGTCTVRAGNLVSGLRDAFAGDVFRVASIPLDAATPISPCLRVKRVSTVGKLVVAQASGVDGRWDVDLSLLGDAWVDLTDNHPSVTVREAWKVSANKSIGFIVYAYVGADLSVYLDNFQFTPTSVPMPYVSPGTTVTSAAGTSGGNGIGFPLETALKECFEKNETDGVELVTNGGFDSADGWVLETGWGIDDGTLVSSGGANANAIATSPIPFILGARYLVNVDLAAHNSGELKMSLGGFAYSLVGTTVKSYGVILQASGNTNKIYVNNNSGNLVGSIDNISIQRLKPATCTVAAEVTMGYGGSDMKDVVSIITHNTSTGMSQLMYTRSYVYNQQAVNRVLQSYDGTTYTSKEGTWSRNERHIKIVQTNADASQFRVGNKRIDIDDTIRWSSWSTFDGSFNPLTHLRLAYGSTVPLWFRKVMVSDEGGMSDEEILARLEA